METIKNYLNSIFANMPNTVEVRKAKRELLQMMEDKYNELTDEGMNENTAVGTVISEFGNLDELAEDLGLRDEIESISEQDNDASYISQDEVNVFLSDRRKKAFLRASESCFA